MMEQAPYSQIQKGTLMVASPEVEAGFFFRSIVLICEHNPSGSFGLLINKPLDLELPDDIIDIESMVNPHISIRAGGPIQANQMMLLHSSNTLPEQTLMICEDVYLGGDLNFLQEIASDPNGPFVHLCFGYCGWGAGQLEREFLDGGWFIHPATSHYIFHTPPEKIWQTVLRDMGGKYAPLSMIPEDLTLN